MASAAIESTDEEPIRNESMRLFSSYQHQELVTREGNEATRQAPPRALRDILSGRLGQPGLDDVYFTRLVMR